MLSCLALLLFKPSNFNKKYLEKKYLEKHELAAFDKVSRDHFEGDLPAFYSAGKILAEDFSLTKKTSLSRLYNPAEQARVQNLYFNLSGNYLQFTYPPLTALFLIPLSYLDIWTAKLVCVVILLLLLLYSVKLYSSLTGYSFAPIFSLTLAFFPLFSSLAGSQNTIISLTLFIQTIYFLRKNNKASDFLAGITLGFLLYKPQFAVILLVGLIVLRFNFSFLLGFSSSALALYFLSAQFFGDNWFFVWVDAVKDFSIKESAVNFNQQVSLLGFLKQDFLKEFISSFLSYNSKTLILMSLIISGVLFLYSYKSDLFKGARINLSLDKYFKLGSFAVFASPHTMYYDVSFILPFLGLILGKTKKSFIYFLLIWVYAAASCLFKESFSFQPMFLLVLATFFIKKRNYYNQ